MKIGLSDQEREYVELIAAKCGLRVEINDKNIIHIPDGLRLLSAAYNKLRPYPSIICKAEISKYKEWVSLLGLK